MKRLASRVFISEAVSYWEEVALPDSPLVVAFTLPVLLAVLIVPPRRSLVLINACAWGGVTLYAFPLSMEKASPKCLR